MVITEINKVKIRDVDTASSLSEHTSASNPHNITPSLINAEPAFAKNTAFNTNFETNVSVLKTAGTRSVGTSENTVRADHVHPAQASVSGNAGTATKLKNARTISLEGGVSGTATTFDGTEDISIPVTSLDATLLDGKVPTASLPTLAEYGAVAVAQGSENKLRILATDINGNVTATNTLGLVVCTFEELKTALETAQSVPIVVGRNIVSKAEINAKTNILNLNGYTISSDGEKHRFMTVKGDVELTGSGFLSDFISETGGGCIYVASYKTFTMNNGVINNCTAERGKGGAVYVDSGATFIMYGGAIRSCRVLVGDGGAVCNLNIFTMYDGAITNCCAEWAGGVYTSGLFTMHGGEIYGCNGTLSVGGVYNNGGEYIVVSNAARIYGNYGYTDVNNMQTGKIHVLNKVTGQIKVTVNPADGDTAGSCTDNAAYVYNITNDAGTFHVEVDATDHTKLIWKQNT